MIGSALGGFAATSTRLGFDQGALVFAGLIIVVYRIRATDARSATMPRSMAACRWRARASIRAAIAGQRTGYRPFPEYGDG